MIFENEVVLNGVFFYSRNSAENAVFLNIPKNRVNILNLTRKKRVFTMITYLADFYKIVAYVIVLILKQSYKDSIYLYFKNFTRLNCCIKINKKNGAKRQI
jgi:hypothetical protein